MTDAEPVQRWPDRLHGALSRVTSSGRYVPVIDGLRFVSIGFVLLYHVGIWPGVVNRTADPVETVVAGALAIGSFGVQLFFAISGLILAQPFAEAAAGGRRAPTFRAYYVRRVSRIEPPFLICILLLFAAQALHRHLSGHQPQVPFPNLLATLTYTHGAIYDEVSPIDPVTWSLEVEVQFYLLAPFVFVALFRMRPALRRAAMAALAAASLWWISSKDLLSQNDDATLARQACFFLAGVLVADLEAVSWKARAETDASKVWRESDVSAADAAPPRRPRLAWDLVPPLAAVLVYLSFRPGSFLHRTPWAGTLVDAACVALAYLGVLRGRLWRPLLELRWIAVIGGMCYSLYLWHYPLMRIVQGRLPASPGGSFLADYAIHAAVLVPFAVVSGAVLFVLFEKPFMHRDWPQRLLRRRASS